MTNIHTNIKPISNPIFRILIFLLACQLLVSCIPGQGDQKESLYSSLTEPKIIPDDPFDNSSVKSDFFTVNAEKGDIINTGKGVVLAIPQNAFLDGQGNIYKGSVQVELAVADKLDEMILSGLETLTMQNEPLETAGMFYFNATVDGKEVYLNSQSPIYMEMPAQGPTDGFMLYQGKRNEDGKIRWTSPRPMEKWLIAFPIDQLDFLPEGFETEVQMGIPFRHYDIADKNLTDSLYFSLKPMCTTCGISPASIKVLHSEKFNNTLIATREFAERLQTIFQTCDKAILDTYINHLDKNLWECDSMAAVLLQGKPDLQNKFKSFAAERKTKVKTDQNLTKLRTFYKNQLKSTEKTLDKARLNYFKQLEREDKAAQRAQTEYQHLLTKRLHYRMTKFGFFLTEKGWTNIDRPGSGSLSSIPHIELNVSVKAGDNYDRTHVYVVNEQIKSIFALSSLDKETFNRAFPEDSILLVYLNQPAVALVIAYKSGQPYFGFHYFRWTDHVSIEVVPEPISEDELRKQIARFNQFYKKENKILIDLEYQERFYKERIRQERLMRERIFLSRLESKAFPCDCSGEVQFAEGANLFRQNCMTCHDLSQKKIGPALKGITRRRPFEWIVRFTHNSQKMIIEGDEEANKLYKDYNYAGMPPFTFLSEEAIRDIINYIDCIETYSE